ncbi:hypothetical protein KC19_8G179600 [Ceratodon purpureus]|uniref:Uncharacterized protein n=1 Tax=Ceratodon purpureus TaxID=3225 RepID=A0A8T0GZM6_CERPU|nr:hypothetical protein KC19_8G179600 [Ceratodon purpureus]
MQPILLARNCEEKCAWDARKTNAYDIPPVVLPNSGDKKCIISKLFLFITRYRHYPFLGNYLLKYRKRDFSPVYNLVTLLLSVLTGRSLGNVMFLSVPYAFGHS